MTQDKIVVEAEVDEVGDLFDDGSMGPDGAGIALRTQRGAAVRRGQILTGREALIAAGWLRPYHRVRVTVEPLVSGTKQALPERDPCGECEGGGGVRIMSRGFEWQDCPTCHGTGEAPRPGTILIGDSILTSAEDLDGA